MGIVQAKDPSEKFLQKCGRQIVVRALKEETDLVQSFLFRQCAPVTGWYGFHWVVHLSSSRGLGWRQNSIS